MAGSIDEWHFSGPETDLLKREKQKQINYIFRMKGVFGRLIKKLTI